MVKSKPKLKSTKSNPPYRKTNPKTFWAMIIIASILGIFLLAGLISMMGVGPRAAATTSTLDLTSHIDGENVTDLIDVKVSEPTSDATFKDAEDVRDPDNYKKLDLDVAEDISFDIRLYEWVKIEIDPASESYFANCEYFVAGGENAINDVIPITVFHLSSDVNFNLFNITTMAATTAANAVNGSYIIIGDFPRISTLERHYGSKWDMSSTEYTKLNAHEKAEFADQRNYRTQAVLYDSAVDTSYKYDTKYLKLTSTFAIKITFNATISRVAGNINYVDIEILNLEDPDAWRVQYGTTVAYIISLKNLKAPLSVTFDLIVGGAATSDQDIACTNLHSGRVTIPEETVTAFSAYSAIAA